jgi:hypothetical protein
MYKLLHGIRDTHDHETHKGANIYIYAQINSDSTIVATWLTNYKFA